MHSQLACEFESWLTHVAQVVSSIRKCHQVIVLSGLVFMYASVSDSVSCCRGLKFDRVTIW